MDTCLNPFAFSCYRLHIRVQTVMNTQRLKIDYPTFLTFVITPAALQ